MKDSFYILKQILEGIDYLHQEKMIHRDIKPENIFILYPKYNDACKLLVNSDNITKSDRNYLIKIGDFGLAKNKINEDKLDFLSTNYDNMVVCQEESKNITIGVGTEIYASPEQLNGFSYDNKSDIYSLGLIIYELFCIIETDIERDVILEKNTRR